MSTEAIIYFGTIAYFIIGWIWLYILELCGICLWTQKDVPSYVTRAPWIVYEIHGMLNDPCIIFTSTWPISFIYFLIYFLWRLRRKIKCKIYLSHKAKMNASQK